MKTLIAHSHVPVTGKKVQVAIKSHLFTRWVDSIDPSLTVRRIEIQSVDTVVRNHEEQVLFLKLKADILDPQGRSLPGIVFLRGASAGILIVLRTPKNEYVVLVESTLPAIGAVSYPQLPAGMMDKETDVLRVVLREMQEETGLDPSEGKMIPLSQLFFKQKWLGIYPSPGACDEMIHLFVYEQNVTEEEVRKLQGKKTGLEKEREHLTLKVVKLYELLENTPDVKAHSAYLMYTTLKNKGKPS